MEEEDAIESRNILKTYFETGDVPTQDQFGSLIDSYVHRLDDNVTIYQVPGGDKRFGIGITTPEAPLGIKATGEEQVIASFNKADEEEAMWFFNLNYNDLSGFNIGQMTDEGMVSRLFIQETQGFLGVGTITPDQKLHVQESAGDGVTAIRILNTATAINQGYALGHEHNVDDGINGGFTIIENDFTQGNKRLVIRPGGNVGINELIPDTKLHVSRSIELPQTDLDLIEGTGIVTIGPMTNNIVADYRGLQARTGEYFGDVLELSASALNLQRLGGIILIHGDDDIDESEKAIITNEARLGLGVMEPLERIEIDGAIKIGNAENEENGTIRYTGEDFEGRRGDEWISLTGQYVPPDIFWEQSFPNTIFYAPTTTARIGVGVSDPAEQIEILGAIKIGNAVNEENGTIRFTGEDFEGRVDDEWLSLTPAAPVEVFWEQGTDNTIYYSPGADSRIGVGVTEPTEQIEIAGAIKIGAAINEGNGTIRFTGTDFEGRVEDEWVSLTPAEPVDVLWEQGTGNVIYYAPGADTRVGIGLAEPSEQLELLGAIRIGDAIGTNNGTIRFTGTDFEGRVDDEWVSLTPAEPVDTYWLHGADNTIYFTEGDAPRIVVGVDYAKASLHIDNGEESEDSSTGAFIYNHATTTSTDPDDWRIGLQIESNGTWFGEALNIGLYISEVAGSYDVRNIAAAIEGNILVGDPSETGYLGTGARRVIAMQLASAPEPGDYNAIQIYCGAQDGIPVFNLMNGDGNVVSLYETPGLTEEDDTVISTTTYGAPEAAVINRLRTRIDELEARLMALGLLAPPVPV